MNPLPPQAYTKDTLVKAYAWLNTQGPSIKEMATTPDILVSLYLKATRDGDSSLDRPSIQNFKNELKSLAGLMGQLDNPQAANSMRSTVSHTAPTANTGSSANSAPAPFAANSAPVTHAAPNHTQGPSAAYSTSSFGGYSQTQSVQPAQAPAGASVQTQPHYTAPVAPVVNPSTLLTGLDALSLSLIQEVKSDLNLSSELEALRMLIKIGHSRSKKLL